MRRFALCVALSASAAQAEVAFAPADILGWRVVAFEGRTDYAAAEKDGEPAVAARCSASASGLALERPVDLTRTPILEWRWRVDATFPADGAERTRPGDDFPARLYVVRDGGVLRWRTRAINYVWAAEGPKGADWPNPFAAQARMVAVRAGTADAGVWRTERRDVRADFRRLHGLDLTEIDAVAIMTDCDNRGGTAEAWYGAIRFLPAD